MLKVKNKRCIRHLADCCFRDGKARNRVAIVAILLTNILFTTVFTMGIGLMETFQHNTKLMAGGDGMAVVKYAAEEEYQAIKDHPLIREISYNMIVDDAVTNPEFLKRHLEMYYMDDVAVKLAFIDLAAGHLPQAEEELCMDTRSLELLGVPLKLGEKITLDMVVKGQPVTRTFTLCGYWEPYELLNAGFALVSRSYVDAHSEELVNTFKENYSMAGTINCYIMFKNSWNLQEKLTRVVEESGYSMDGNAENGLMTNVSWAYLSSGMEAEPMVMLALIGGILLIILTGYLIIYNIFQISVIRDIRFYGLLKTIGTTGKQIRTLIRRQTLRLCLYGIPLGLVIGFVVGRLMMPVLMSGSSYGASHIRVTLNPLIFVAAILFTMFTVYISSRKPGRIAASVSPVEAARYSLDGKEKRRSKKSTDGGKIYRMAFSNLGRSKKRTFLVLVSMSLSVILLNSTVSLVNSFDQDKYFSKFVDTDFLIADAEYFNNRFFGPEEAVSESFIEAVEAQPGFEEGGRLFYDPDFRIKNYYKNAHKEHYDDGVNQMEMWVDDDGQFYYGDEEGNPFGELYGLQKLPLSRLHIVEGETDLEKLQEALDSGDFILAGVEPDDEGNIIEEFDIWKVGDEITVFRADGTERKCKILAKIEMKYFTNTVRRWGNGISFYTSETGFEKLSMKKDTMSYAFQVADDKEADMEAFLKNYTENTEPLMGYDSKYTWQADFEQFKSMFSLIGNGLACIIGIIGILNFVNTVLTGIVTRSREFATLKSIGMTKRQLTRMLCLEGLYYTVGTVIISLFLSVTVSVTVVRILADLFWFTSYRFTILPALLVSPCLLLLGVLVPCLTEKFTGKESIVEQLRQNE